MKCQRWLLNAPVASRTIVSTEQLPASLYLHFPEGDSKRFHRYKAQQQKKSSLKSLVEAPRGQFSLKQSLQLQNNRVLSRKLYEPPRPLPHIIR